MEAQYLRKSCCTEKHFPSRGPSRCYKASLKFLASQSIFKVALAGKLGDEMGKGGSFNGRWGMPSHAGSPSLTPSRLYHKLFLLCRDLYHDHRRSSPRDCPPG
eukprot:g13018.t1